jgi:hypothetical protein
MRGAVNSAIRAGLMDLGEGKGGVGREAVTITSMMAVDFTAEQARQYKNYERGMIVQFRRDLKRNKKLVAERGSQWTIKGRDDEGLRLQHSDGRVMSWRPSDRGANTYIPAEIALAKGDQIVFRLNDKTAGVDNGQAGRVSSIDVKTGAVTVKTEPGDEVRLEPNRAYALDYGYCRTIHSAQGATVERAIVVGESGRVATAETAYVAASRETLGLEIITDNIARLSAAWTVWSERIAASSLVTGNLERPETQQARAEIALAQAAAAREAEIAAEIAAEAIEKARATPKMEPAARPGPSPGMGW